MVGTHTAACVHIAAYPGICAGTIDGHARRTVDVCLQTCAIHVAAHHSVYIVHIAHSARMDCHLGTATTISNIGVLSSIIKQNIISRSQAAKHTAILTAASHRHTSRRHVIPHLIVQRLSTGVDNLATCHCCGVAVYGHILSCGQWHIAQLVHIIHIEVLAPIAHGRRSDAVFIN